MTNKTVPDYFVVPSNDSVHLLYTEDVISKLKTELEEAAKRERYLQTRLDDALEREHELMQYVAHFQHRK